MSANSGPRSASLACFFVLGCICGAKQHHPTGNKSVAQTSKSEFEDNKRTATLTNEN